MRINIGVDFSAPRSLSNSQCFGTSPTQISDIIQSCPDLLQLVYCKRIISSIVYDVFNILACQYMIPLQFWYRIQMLILMPWQKGLIVMLDSPISI
jgi:hypothetical protein